MNQIEQANVPLWAFGDAYREESSPASPRCAEPGLWSMMDEVAPEVEVLKFLRCMVALVKPHVAVTVGDKSGYASLHMGQAMRENGRGRVFVAELDEASSKHAQATCLSSGLNRWISFSGWTPGVSIPMAVVCGGDAEVAQSVWQMMEPGGLLFLHRVASDDLPAAMSVRILQLPTPRGLLLVQR